MGCGASADQGQTYTWHGKWGGDDEPGEYVLGRVPGCLETAVLRQPASPTAQRYAKPRTSFLGDAKLAVDMAARMMDEGVYVIGFNYPVVPKGKARIRVQISAAHTREHLETAIAAFQKVGKEMGVIQ